MSRKKDWLCDPKTLTYIDPRECLERQLDFLLLILIMLFLWVSIFYAQVLESKGDVWLANLWLEIDLDVSLAFVIWGILVELDYFFGIGELFR